LWIEQQRDIAVRCRQVLDVVGEDGVEIADAVWPGEGKIAAVIFIDQGDGFVRVPIFALPIAEIVRQSAAEPNAHLRAGLLVQRRERRVGYLCGFGGLHICRHGHLYSVAKACLLLGRRGTAISGCPAT